MTHIQAATRNNGVLHFFCGKAGAGKSTIACSVAQAEGATLISEDVWLSRLYGDQMHTFEDYRRVSERLKTVVGPLAVDLLRAGTSLVLDFPANTKTARTWFRSLCEQSGADHVLHVAEATDEMCLQRIDRRNSERPEGSHHLTPELFAYISSFFEMPKEQEGFTISRHVPGERNISAAVG